jgi:hypothetical protein
LYFSDSNVWHANSVICSQCALLSSVSISWTSFLLPLQSWILILNTRCLSSSALLDWLLLSQYAPSCYPALHTAAANVLGKYWHILLVAGHWSWLREMYFYWCYIQVCWMILTVKYSKIITVRQFSLSNHKIIIKKIKGSPT